MDSVRSWEFVSSLERHVDAIQYIEWIYDWMDEVSEELDLATMMADVICLWTHVMERSGLVSEKVDGQLGDLLVLLSQYVLRRELFVTVCGRKMVTFPGRGHVLWLSEAVPVEYIMRRICYDDQVRVEDVRKFFVEIGRQICGEICLEECGRSVLCESQEVVTQLWCHPDRMHGSLQKCRGKLPPCHFMEFDVSTVALVNRFSVTEIVQWLVWDASGGAVYEDEEQLPAYQERDGEHRNC